jgi:hypothetical protein
MKDPDDVGWDPPARKPKSLPQLLALLQAKPLVLNPPTYLDPIPSLIALHRSLYLRLSAATTHHDPTLATFLSLLRTGRPHLVSYQASVTEPPHQLHTLQTLARCLPLIRLRKKIISKVVKLQALARGYLIRKSLMRAYRRLVKGHAARAIQRWYRGHRVRKRVLDMYFSLIST